MTYENGALSTVQALADVAVDDNMLFYDGYVKGTAEFIKDCATPMTIAIQGDWGTGKSSLINLIERELREEDELDEYDDPNERWYCEDIVNVATVDVWRQAVANPRVSLLEILLAEVIAKLTGVSREYAESVSGLVSAASQLLTATDGGKGDAKEEDDSLLGSILGSLFGSEEESKGKSGEEVVSVKDIEEFQAEFAETLRQVAEYNDKSDDSRFVVFVDGLDHIDPQAAVDLMEQIKICFDCPRCVFVLAVDEKTVFDGVRKRLGDKADEGRKKMFFDRLVQVPLRIPAATCNLDKYIEELLKDEKELSGEFVKVVNTLTSKPTPVSIKRCINTTYLYRSIFDGQENIGGSSLVMLFAAVFLEIESTQGFNAVAGCAQGDEALFDESLKAALDSLGNTDGINWAKLPALWNGGEGVDAAKRSAFISWMRKLK